MNWPPRAASFVSSGDLSTRTARDSMTRPKRILLYGFGPYQEFDDNITARIIKALPRRPGLKKIVFPVRFHRAQFIKAIVRTKPEIILGLGQSSRRKIDVESQARNHRRARRSAQPRVISPGGPKNLKTTLKLKVGRLARISTNAGDYVCNFSMYVMLDHIRDRSLDSSYGFIHIPHDYEPIKATGFIAKILRGW